MLVVSVHLKPLFLLGFLLNKSSYHIKLGLSIAGKKGRMKYRNYNTNPTGKL